MTDKKTPSEEDLVLQLSKVTLNDNEKEFKVLERGPGEPTVCDEDGRPLKCHRRNEGVAHHTPPSSHQYPLGVNNTVGWNIPPTPGLDISVKVSLSHQNAS